MTKRQVITKQNGDYFCVNRGESVTLSGTFTNCTEEVLEKESIEELVLTIYNPRDGSIVNGRDKSDIKDANGGSLTAAGVLTLKLSGDDTELTGSSVAGEIEPLHLLYEWTWFDLDLDLQTGREEFILNVMETPR